MNKFLIVTDMQNDFIDGVLGTPEARSILSSAIRRIHQARAEGYTIIATMDTHRPDYLTTSEGQHLPVEYCIRETAGWELNAQVREALGEDAIIPLLRHRGDVLEG